VNALRHAHTLLAPGGTLVDAHPVTEERVESARGIVGTIAEPDWRNVDLPNSEDGLRQVVREGLFTLEAEVSYVVLEHFDDATELVASKHDTIDGQHELISAIRAATPPLRTHFSVTARRLRATPRSGLGR
jgi:hypothetical protein